MSSAKDARDFKGAVPAPSSSCSTRPWTFAASSTLSHAQALFFFSSDLGLIASGLYGCAHLPTTLKWIDRFVAWSLIKFFIILAGIMAAQAILATYGHPYRKPRDIPSRLFYTSLFLSVSFTIFVFYCSRENILAALDRLGLRSRLSKIHRFMTRYAKPKTKGVSKSLEEMIFDSLSEC